jgi:hypothetical protein
LRGYNSYYNPVTRGFLGAGFRLAFSSSAFFNQVEINKQIPLNIMGILLHTEKNHAIMKLPGVE